MNQDVKHTSEIVAHLREFADRIEKIDAEIPVGTCHFNIGIKLFRDARDGFTNRQAMGFVDTIAELCELGPVAGDDVYYRPVNRQGTVMDLVLWPLATPPAEVVPQFDPEI